MGTIVFGFGGHVESFSSVDLFLEVQDVFGGELFQHISLALYFAGRDGLILNHPLGQPFLSEGFCFPILSDLVDIGLWVLAHD
jgi:hypothetical protein